MSIGSLVTRSVARVKGSIRLRRVFTDADDRRVFNEALRGRSAGIGRDDAIKLRLRALDGGSVWIRPATSDPQVLFDAFVHGYHRPPRRLRGEIRTIWDLGANIGLTAIDLATLFPRAAIVAVELDASNADLALRNLAPWSRCRLIQSAVWSRDAEVSYRRWPGSEYGSAVLPAARWDSPLPDARASAISLDSLLASSPADERIDYVKMDIEGSERFVLRDNTKWAAAVRCIQVEVHPPYTVQRCVQDLIRLGFEVTVPRGYPERVIGMDRQLRRRT
jgi:FkbM family methyltransferase